MKKILTLGLSCTCLLASALVLNTQTKSLNETAEDTMMKNNPSIELRKAVIGQEGETSYSPTYVQYGKDAEGKYCLRFATAVKGNISKLTYTRTLEGLENNVVDVSTVYIGINAGDKTYYYNGTDLTTDETSKGDYYWACYTIQFATDTYKASDITASLVIEDNEGNKATPTSKTASLQGLIEENPCLEGHTLTKVNRIEPTLSTDGKEEYYKCDKCQLLFADEKGEQQIQESDLRIKRGQVLTLQDATSDSNVTALKEANGVITYDGTIDRASNLIFGQQDNNDKQVFECDINVDWKNEWSILTLWFGKWDNNTAFTIKVQPNQITFQKKYWDNGGKTEDLKTITNYTFKENQTIHVTMMMHGWTRTVMFDDYVVAHIDNSLYTVGYVGIETWDVDGYTLTNPVLRNYADNALPNDYPQIWYDYAE